MSLLNDDLAREQAFQAVPRGTKVFTSARLLIVEDETLIALDIQRAINGANGKNTVFARSLNEFARSAESLEQFDLAIVNPPRPGTEDGYILDRLIAAGTAIVICSAAATWRSSDTPPNLEWVSKPFSDDELLAACARALRKLPRVNPGYGW